MSKKEVSDDTKALTTLDESYYKDNAKVGLEELEQEDIPTPTLSLIQNNSTIVDDDNRPLPRGKFYYKGNKKVYDSVDCAILVLTKKELPDFSNKEELVKNYIFLGALEPELAPFLLYLKRTGIGTAKQFLGEVVALKRPMYSLKVRLESEKINGEKGDYYKIKFSILGIRKSQEEILILEDLAKQYSPKVKEEVGELEAKQDEQQVPF